MGYIQLQECPTSSMKNVIRNRSSHPDVPYMTRTQCITYLERMGLFHLQDDSPSQENLSRETFKEKPLVPQQRELIVPQQRELIVPQQNTSFVSNGDAILSNVFVKGALRTKNLTLNGKDVLSVIEGANATIQDLNTTMSVVNTSVANTNNIIRYNKINSRHHHVSSGEGVEIQVLSPNEELSYWSSIETQYKTIVSTSSVDWSAVVSFTVDGINGELPPSKLKVKLPFRADTTKFRYVLPVYAYAQMVNINNDVISRPISFACISYLDDENVFIEHVFTDSKFSDVAVKSVSVYVSAVYPIVTSPFPLLIPMRFDAHHAYPVTSGDVQLPDGVDLSNGFLSWSHVGSRIQLTGELTVEQAKSQNINTPIFVNLPNTSDISFNHTIGNGIAFPNSNSTYKIKVIIDPETPSKLRLFVSWNTASKISNILNVQFQINYNVDERVYVRLEDSVFTFVTTVDHEFLFTNFEFNNIQLVDGSPAIKSFWFIRMMVSLVTKQSCIDQIDQRKSLEDSMILSPVTHCTVNVLPTSVSFERMHVQEFTYHGTTYIKKHRNYRMSVAVSLNRSMYHYTTITRGCPIISIHPHSLQTSRSTSHMFIRSISLRKHRLLTTYLSRPRIANIKNPILTFAQTGPIVALYVNFPSSGGILTCTQREMCTSKSIVRLTD